MRYKETDIYKCFSIMGKRFWLFTIGCVGNAAIMAFCFNIVLAIIMKDLFNAAFEGRTDLLFRAVVISLISLIIALVVQPIFVFISKLAQKQTMRDLRLKGYNHMTKLPISYFEKHHSGEVTTNLTSDIKVIEDIYDTQFDRIAFILLLGTGSTILMFVYDWRIAVYALILEGLSIITSFKISKGIKTISLAVQGKKSKVSSSLLDIVAGYKTTKIYQVEDTMLENFQTENENLTDLENKRDKLSSLINTIGFFFYTTKSLGIIVIGLYFVATDIWDMGTLIAMFNLQNNMGVFSNLGDAIGKLQRSMAGVSRISQLLNQQIESRGALPDGEAKSQGAILSIRNVSFSYEDKKVLDDISIEVNKGESIALVGKSGCGKSTLTKLLVGFYDVTGGEIYLNGKSTKQYNLEDLREKIAYVPQTPYLFSGSIKDNIRYGRLGASDEEILNAAMLANAHEFIIHKQHGYDTIVGEGGVALSGGEKQRIAIARALIKKAEIFIFDEATAALDANAESQIQEVIKNIMQQKTVIIIAHRLSSIKDFDSIIVLDEGRVVAPR